MTENRQYTAAVESGVFPHGSDVPLDDAFSDQRGEIRNIVLDPIGSVARIHSKRGAVRANHWHRTDWHYALVEDGQVLYFERPAFASAIPEPQVFGPGQMFFTPPMREHAMLFAVDSTIFTFSRLARTHEAHEGDLVRVSFITPEIAAEFLK